MQIKFISSIHAVNADEWNSLCPDNYPFIRHEFLSALEDSGSTTASSGWQAQHLLVYIDKILEDETLQHETPQHETLEDKKLVAVMPLFIKSHSYGEYVFDWAWADAYQRYGYHYYPKLISAIPFTPCYGPRLLHRHQPTMDDLAKIIHHVQAHAKALGASGWHCLFPDETDCAQLESLGIRARLGCQFHWFNHSYNDFGDFLARMSSRKRKNIIKERRQVIEQGFTFIVKEGNAITTSDWDFFADLYRLTYLKRSGHSGYLQREFFHALGERLPQYTLMILAQQHLEPVAAAFFLRDQETLYGRYWGCREEFDFLHFETCYYQGIDYAIARGIKRFDGGAQGEHKIQRGFEPIATWSNHWLAQEEFRQPVAQFLQEEEKSVKRYIEDAKTYLPFKTPSDSPI